MATYSDQFYNLDPANPPTVGQTVTFSLYALNDANNDGDLDRFNGDSVAGVDIISSWPGDTVTILDTNGNTITYTGTTFYLSDGQRVFTPTDGQVLENGTFVSTTWVSGQGPLLVGQLGPACFTKGARIRVPGGEVRIETLKPGDLVETLDRGPQVLRWIGRRMVAGTGDFAPVRIERGVLGNDRDLLVSPEHRMLVAGWAAELFFGEAEVLVAARHLLGKPGVGRQPMDRVEYIHLLFDRHEIVFAEGAPSESFHPDSLLLERDRALRAEIGAIFPEIVKPRHRKSVRAVRRVVTGHEARMLAA